MRFYYSENLWLCNNVKSRDVTAKTEADDCTKHLFHTFCATTFFYTTINGISFARAQYTTDPSISVREANLVHLSKQMQWVVKLIKTCYNNVLVEVLFLSARNNSKRSSSKRDRGQKITSPWYSGVKLSMKSAPIDELRVNEESVVDRVDSCRWQIPPFKRRGWELGSNRRVKYVGN